MCCYNQQSGLLGNQPWHPWKGHTVPKLRTTVINGMGLLDLEVGKIYDK